MSIIRPRLAPKALSQSQDGCLWVEVCVEYCLLVFVKPLEIDIKGHGLCYIRGLKKRSIKEPWWLFYFLQDGRDAGVVLERNSLVCGSPSLPLHMNWSSPAVSGEPHLVLVYSLPPLSLQIPWEGCLCVDVCMCVLPSLPSKQTFSE